MNYRIRILKIKDFFLGYNDFPVDGVIALSNSLRIYDNYKSRKHLSKVEEEESLIIRIIYQFPFERLIVQNKGEYFKLLDGKKRLYSTLRYIDNKYSVKGKKFTNLSEDMKKRFMNTEVPVYFYKANIEEVTNPRQETSGVSSYYHVLKSGKVGT